MGDEAVVRTAALSKSFKGTVALRDVDLTIERGEIFGYLGPNGAGKTTTLRLLMGMLRPTSGRATVLGQDAWQHAVDVHRRVGYLPGEPALYGKLTGHQHVSYFGHLRRDPDNKSAARLAARLDLELDRPARELSKGNRQKLALVLAMMSGPELLILDEPTSGLDPIVQQEFHTLLREHTEAGGSVLLSSHVLGEVQRVADRIGVVRAGRLIAVERMADLRVKSLHHVAARFTDEVGAEEFSSVDGVRDLVVAGPAMTCMATQSALDGLLRQVTRHRVVDLDCAEADLEETFLAYYGGGDHDAT
ncbi:ABC-2 type transport system ATP-binding protein [Nakamurella panacisegetis]|uniref:ABC-2 type transport system ATP-binding protein n=1 Tax=Nakamurella panacisegetis TaxID=1090615 RepID=A0A1H0QX78_9ACTN|nr:ABC transporter ATP-binding protein [Nakamurella panacisegetis]SDP21891.1 ABC-2 type transport system ATP-binding protein [Nakamurella panacisegetis]